MRNLSILLLLFVIGSFADSDVLKLDSTNFDAAIQDNPLILVEFYAPWCGHCKKLAPEWEKAATELKEKGINAKLAAVDADDKNNAVFINRFDIRGFPTIKRFRDGVDTEYNGERTAEFIVNYLKKQSSPASTSLTSVDQASTFSESERVVIVGFFDNQDSDEYKNFREVSNKLRDLFTFGEVIGNSEVNVALGVDKTPSIVLFKDFDERRNVYESGSDLAEFINSNSLPTIDEIGPHNFKSYMDVGLPLAYLFVDLSVEGQKDQYLAEVKDLAKQTKGKLNWVFIDWSKYAKHAERLGLSGKTVPALAIERMEEGIHWAYDEVAKVAKEDVTTWVNKFLNGELQATIKSEPIPENNNGPVKIVVAHNFEEIVNDPTKDVLLEFYAPWCGHCKKLSPVYDELASDLKDSFPNVVVAKMDATANDVNPKFQVRGFPTIKLFLAKDKQNPIDYEGDRSLEDMTEFIEDRAQVSDFAKTTEKKDEL